MTADTARIFTGDAVPNRALLRLQPDHVPEPTRQGEGEGRQEADQAADLPVMPSINDRLTERDSPAVHLRDQLAEARRNGEPWETAWSDCVEYVLACIPASAVGMYQGYRSIWREVFTSTEDAWRAGYSREPGTRLSLDLLADTYDETAYPDDSIVAGGRVAMVIR